MKYSKEMEDKYSEIITRLVNKRDDIPSTFAIDGDLADDAMNLLIGGYTLEAANVLYYALCKEYGYAKPLKGL